MYECMISLLCVYLEVCGVLGKYDALKKLRSQSSAKKFYPIVTIFLLVVMQHG